MRTTRNFSKFDITNDFGYMYTMEDLVNIYFALTQKCEEEGSLNLLTKLTSSYPHLSFRDLYTSSKYNAS